MKKRERTDWNVGWYEGELWWLELGTNNPVEPVGVSREMDVPGTNGSVWQAKVHSLPVDRQIKRMWLDAKDTEDAESS